MHYPMPAIVFLHIVPGKNGNYHEVTQKALTSQVRLPGEQHGAPGGLLTFGPAMLLLLLQAMCKLQHGHIS